MILNQQAAEALRLYEERLRVALMNVPLVLYTTDRELRYTWIHGPHRDLSHEELPGKLLEVKQRVLDQGAGERKEIEIETGAGVQSYDVTIEPLLDAVGAIAGVTVAALDITQRTRAEAAIQRREQDFRELADSMPQIVWAARPDGYLDYYNERWYEFTGFPRGKGGDTSWAPILHAADVEYCHNTWYGAVLSGQPYEIEYRFWDRSSGRYRWFLGRALPVKDEAGNVIRWFGTCTDIDQQKRLVEKLRAANEDLNQFAYSASHDLKEPLRMVAVYSQLLQRKLENQVDRETAEYLGYTIQGAQRMETLVYDLLMYTEAATVDIVKTAEVDSNVALQTALSNLRLSIEESGAGIDAGHLPVVRAHEVHVVQLFQNLIGNAIKYRSVEQSRIRVLAEQHGAEWMFSVADNGIGIAPKYHSQIFGVFKRLHTRVHSPGTGIGLAICKKITERYGGRIWVDAEEGRGSTFYFTLPAGDAAAH